MQHFTRTIITFFLSLFLVITGCKNSFKHEIKKEENALTIFQNDSTTVQIEIIDESIIHVTKQIAGTPQSTIPDYVTVLEPQNISWNYTESEDELVVSTDLVNVILSSDGTIQYTSKDGKDLLSETNEGSFIKETNEGHDVSQAFIAGDEALYGLGQFQSGIMNWKNVPIRLQQYNQEIAIPFLVSTKGYGIYWHNYSLTDFNAPQNEIEFAIAQEVVGNKKEAAVTVVDGEKENVAAFSAKKAKQKNIRKTTFTPTKTGQYSFLALSDHEGRMRGELKVTIDGEDVINYSTIWMPRRYSGQKYLEAGKTYEVVFQNTGAKIPGKLFYNEPDFNKTVFSSTVGSTIDYYFIHGAEPANTIAEYQKLTGKAPMFSKKSYGFWQCRERYHNQKELLENASEMRKREIPFDNIVQDWFYWPEGTKGPEWDRKKYPDPKAMVDELKSLDLNLMVSVWPEVKHKSLEEKYNLTKIKASNKLDFHDPKVSERFYKMLSDSMFQIGVKSIWLDGTEPAGSPKNDVQTAAGPNDAVYNTYSLLVTKSVYEGRRKEFPKERVFNLTRSAYAGQQRYGATSWSGDTEASWEQFSEQITAGLNFTMAGVPYWTHDIGGFFRDSKSINPQYDDQYTNPEFIELLTRWFQFGAFSPIFRIHGYVSETEIWRYNEAFETTARQFIDLRYQLMPYIYSQAWQITNNSRQLMSPLAYHYPNDKKTWGIKDQLFFGESIMVGFVTEYGQREKDIYLPNGAWYNFWTSKKLQGGKTITTDAPLNQTPMFVKAGSIIPFGPKVQFATQKTDKPIQLNIYPGKDATYTLYFDDNESYKYEDGTYSEILLNYSELNKTLEFKKGNGDFINFKQSPMEFVVKLIGGNSNKINFEGNDLKIAL